MNLNIHQSTSTRLPEQAGVTMTSLEIASLTGKQHPHVLRDIREMIEAVKDDPDLDHQLKQELTEHKDSRGYTSHFDLTRFAAELLITGYDIARRARVLNRLLELETRAIKPISNTKIAAELAVAETVARMLRVAPSGQLLMIEAITKNNGLDASFLPSYAVDAPSGSTTGSSEPTAAITQLLKTHDINYGAVAYNKMLSGAGIIEQLTRPKKGGGTQSYWNVTEKGLRYGKNVTSQYSQLETQPHWYVGRFNGMHDEVVRLTGGEA